MRPLGVDSKRLFSFRASLKFLFQVTISLHFDRGEFDLGLRALCTRPAQEAIRQLRGISAGEG